MQFLPPDKWIDLGLSTTTERFLYLRWHELFDHRTFLSWQLRTTDLKSVCEELRQSIEVTSEFHSHHPNILRLLDELEHLVARHKQLRHRHPQVCSLVSSMRRTYEERTRSAEIKDVTHLKSLLKKTEKLLHFSKTLLLEELDRIVAAPTTEKKALDLCLSTLAALLRNEGYSYFYLKDLTDTLVGDSPIADRWSRWKSCVELNEKNYAVRFLVKLSESAFAAVDPDGTYQFEDRDMLAADPDESIREFLEIDQEATVMRFAVSSLDSFGAVAQASQTLLHVTAPQWLYRKKALISQTHSEILVTDPEGNHKIFNQKSLRLPESTQSSKLESDLNGIYRLYSSISNQQRRLLVASLKYYDVFMGADDEEIRFLNLWIALESLFQEADGANIIGRIRSTLPDVVSSVYIHNLLTATARDIHYLRRTAGTADIDQDFPNSTSTFIDPMDLLVVLCDEEDGESIRRLLEFAGRHELLVHRINSLWEGYFKDRKVFVRRMERHRTNVDWQILRLYRVRNSITHRGMPVGEIAYLTHHLNHYYRIVVHRCIKHLIADPTGSVMDALLSIREDYRHVLGEIGTHKQVYPGQLIAFDPSNRAGPPLWERE